MRKLALANVAGAALLMFGCLSMAEAGPVSPAKLSLSSGSVEMFAPVAAKKASKSKQERTKTTQPDSKQRCPSGCPYSPGDQAPSY